LQKGRGGGASVPEGEEDLYFTSHRKAYLDLHAKTCPGMALPAWWARLIALLGLAIGVLNCEYTLGYKLWKGVASVPTSAQVAACLHLATLVSAYLGSMPEEEPRVHWPTFLQRRRVTYEGEAVQHAHRLTLRQIVPALPPEGLGASIEALRLLQGPMRAFLENPSLSLLDDADLDDLPKAGAFLVEPGEEVPIARELLRRGFVRP
jgi:hypothetical protein